MESIGEKLRTTRTQKGYSIEQVARDTHIAKRFVEAMETEDFDVFPGEPYLLGFLRTYSEFLELDSQEMVGLYKNLKIQEQPAPIDDLVVKKSPRPYVIAALAVLVLGGLGVGGFFLVRAGVIGQWGEGSQGQQSAQTTETREAASEEEGRQFLLQDQVLERRFSQGDTVRVPVGDNEYPFSIEEVTEEGVSVSTIERATMLDLDSERMIDVDQNGEGDLQVLVREVDPAESPPSVVMRLDRVVQSPVASGGVDGEEAVPSDTEAVGETNVSEREQSAQVIEEFDEREEFEIEIEFRGYTWFRHVIDGEQREEQYMESGDTFRASAREEFRLWLSNAGAAGFRVAGREVDLGDPGEVVTGIITWAGSEDDETVRLELVPLY
ncbi:MAG: RodZ domain-containing protein [Spirochaetota bacterium]